MRYNHDYPKVRFHRFTETKILRYKNFFFILCIIYLTHSHYRPRRILCYTKSTLETSNVAQWLYNIHALDSSRGIKPCERHRECIFSLFDFPYRSPRPAEPKTYNVFIDRDPLYP